MLRRGLFHGIQAFSKFVVSSVDQSVFFRIIQDYAGHARIIEDSLIIMQNCAATELMQLCSEFVRIVRD